MRGDGCFGFWSRQDAREKPSESECEFRMIDALPLLSGVFTAVAASAESTCGLVRNRACAAAADAQWASTPDSGPLLAACQPPASCLRAAFCSFYRRIEVSNSASQPPACCLRAAFYSFYRRIESNSQRGAVAPFGSMLMCSFASPGGRAPESQCHTVLSGIR